ncbi:NusG domain II-containing protein [Ruminococcus sp. FC2018]|uniref:NusG domain II-containing protein n=1 Tax=Ruminococcus sp. FC2018 TaxID=1410617 RepID=UPI000683E3EB|nr:NusG domain II-containing protein [Ruminococcus sp. FC2018]
MKKNVKWAIVFGSVVAICVFVIIFGQLKSDKKGAEIYVDRKLYKAIDSIEDQETKSILIETENGWNRVCYGRGEIWVEEADCKNQVCVKHAKASFVGSSIICAPHKLVIKVVGGSGSGADAEV